MAFGDKIKISPDSILAKYIKSIKQTTTSAADSGSNIITATDSEGGTSNITIKNGSKGSTGPQGATGATGPQGPTGPQGKVGATGPQGPNGATGPTGPQGVAGAAGAKGATGPTGPQGAAGAAGSRGPQGAVGPVGPTGPQGATGSVDYSKAIVVTRGVDFNPNTAGGYKAGMTNAKSPIANTWYHTLSMDWDGNSTTSWNSVLALPTQQGGVPYYKRNNTGSTDIANSTWHAFLTDENYKNYVNWIVDRMHLEDYNYDVFYSPLKGVNGSENTNNYIIVKSKENLAIMFGYANIPYTMNRITVNFPTTFGNPPYVFLQQFGNHFSATRPLTVTAVKSQSFSVVVNYEYTGMSVNERAERAIWLAIGRI